jgi:hypothetical protein
MKRSRKLTRHSLRSLVLKEAKKLQNEALAQKIEDTSKVKADEYEAGEEAETLAQGIDFLKKLNIHEKRVLRKLRQIREHKKLLRKKLINELK